MHPVAELSNIASEFHHLQAEHAREGAEGSWRRRQRARMDELEQSFETIVQRWVPDPDEQTRWREHLYRGAERPDVPTDEPPIFRGRSDHGSTLVIVVNDGDQVLLVDGAPVARWAKHRTMDAPLRYNSLHFHEFYEASPAALEALADTLSDGASAAPWAFARELYEDGLIDANFGLTARGQRFHQSRQAA